MENHHKYFDLLELTPEASLKEVRSKYTYLKNLYSGDSIELLALNEDFSAELRNDYLSRIEAAYEQLSLLFEDKNQTLIPPALRINDEARLWIGQIDCFDGATLRAVRERLGIELKDMFAVTRIQLHYLQDIENEVFDLFRAEVYLRSFIIEYARFLCLDAQKVLSDYLPRYRSWAASREGQDCDEVPDILAVMKRENVGF